MYAMAYFSQSPVDPYHPFRSLVNLNSCYCSCSHCMNSIHGLHQTFCHTFVKPQNSIACFPRCQYIHAEHGPYRKDSFRETSKYSSSLKSGCSEPAGVIIVTIVGLRVDLHIFGKLIFDLACDVEGEGSPVADIAGEAWSNMISFDKYYRRRSCFELIKLRDELIGIIERCDCFISQSVGPVQSGESSVAAGKCLLSSLFGIDNAEFALEKWMAKYKAWQLEKGEYV